MIREFRVSRHIYDMLENNNLQCQRIKVHFAFPRVNFMHINFPGKMKMKRNKDFKRRKIILICAWSRKKANNVYVYESAGSSKLSIISFSLQCLTCS